MSPRSRAAIALAGLLGASGTLHFLTPQTFDELVPTAILPGTARFWTLASGAAEIGIAAAVAAPRTRRLGALAAVALLVAVFPANIKMAVDWSTRTPVEATIAYVRLPLQIPLVMWALRVRRDAVR
jgi:uncharacterized membrane protein